MLVIIAKARANPGHENHMVSEQLKLAAAAQQAPGCLRYEVNLDNSDPGLVIFTEQWTSREAWQHHMGSDYMRAFKQSVGDAIASTDIWEMTQKA